MKFEFISLSGEIHCGLWVCSSCSHLYLCVEPLSIRRPFEREKRAGQSEWVFFRRPKSHFYLDITEADANYDARIKEEKKNNCTASPHAARHIVLNRFLYCRYKSNIFMWTLEQNNSNGGNGHGDGVIGSWSYSAANQHLLIWTQKCTVIRMPR